MKTYMIYRLVSSRGPRFRSPYWHTHTHTQTHRNACSNDSLFIGPELNITGGIRHPLSQQFP